MKPPPTLSLTIRLQNRPTHQGAEQLKTPVLFGLTLYMYVCICGCWSTLTLLLLLLLLLLLKDTHIPALCTRTPLFISLGSELRSSFPGLRGNQGGLWVVTPTTNPKTSSLIRFAYWIFVVLEPILLFYGRDWLNVGLLDWLSDC